MTAPEALQCRHHSDVPRDSEENTITTVRKLKQWEKERRERLNICFRDLASVLPCHDPAVTLSKVQILQRAAKYIRELQSENRVLVGEGASEVGAKQLQLLQQRSDDLLRRVQQLVELLQDAGITIPSAVSVKSEPLKDRQLKWDNKIKPEQAKILEEKAKEKKSENRRKAQKWKKSSKCENPGTCLETKFLKRKGSVQKRSKTGSSSNTSSCPSKTDRPHEHRQPLREQSNLSLRDKNSEPVSILSKSGTVTCTASAQAGVGAAVSRNPAASSSKCFVEPGAPRVTNTSCGKKMVVSVTNSHLLTPPVVSPSVQSHSTSGVVGGSPGLVPGTIIFTSGSIVPVLPAPQTVITTPAQYIVNTNHHVPVLHKPPVVMLQKSAPTSVHLPPRKRGKTFPLLMPKRRTDSAKVKFPNKVPISASASQYLPLQPQSENTNFMVAKTSVNKRTLNASYHKNADCTSPNKEKVNGNIKRRKVSVVSKISDKQEKVVKHNILDGTSNKISAAVKSTDSTAECKALVATDSTEANTTEVDGKLKVVDVVQPEIIGSERTGNSKENEGSNMQDSSVQRVHSRRTKKKIVSKEEVKHAKASGKKSKFSETLDGERLEIFEAQSVQSGDVSEMGNVTAVCASAPSVKASSEALPSPENSADDVHSIVSPNNVGNTHNSDPSVSGKLPQGSGLQENHVKVGIVAPSNSGGEQDDSTVNKHSVDAVTDVISNVVLHDMGSSSSETASTNTTTVATSSACSSKVKNTTSDEANKLSAIPIGTECCVLQDISSNRHHDCTSTELQESACISSVVQRSSSQINPAFVCTMLNEDGQNSGGKDSKLLEELSTICERDSDNKSHHHLGVNNKSTTSGTHSQEGYCDTDEFSLPVQTFGAFDQANGSTESSVTIGAMLSMLPSEGLQNKTCIDGASKKNTSGTYTIDALCKTSACNGMDSEFAGKDVNESAPVPSVAKETNTGSLLGSDSVVNSGGRFMGGTEHPEVNTEKSESNISVDAQNYDGNNTPGKPNTHGFTTSSKGGSGDGSDNISSNYDDMSAPKKSSPVNESVSMETVPPAKKAPVLSSCEGSLQSTSLTGAVGNKHSSVSNETGFEESTPDQHDTFVGKQQCGTDSSRVMEQITACIKEACPGETSAMVSATDDLRTSETVAAHTTSTPQNCSENALENTLQRSKLSVFPVAGESASDRNKQVDENRCTDGSHPLGSATNFNTLPGDGNLYTSSDCLPNAPPSYPVKSSETLVPLSCYSENASGVISKPDSGKPHGELMSVDANIPACNILRGSVTSPYEKNKSEVEHVQFGSVSGTQPHSVVKPPVECSVPVSQSLSEMQPPVTCATENVASTSYLHARQDPSIPLCNFTPSDNSQLQNDHHMMFSSADGRCNVTSQCRDEMLVSAPTTFAPVVYTFAQAQTRVTCSATADVCTSSLQQKCDQATSAPTSFTPAHTFSQKQPRQQMSYSASDSFSLSLHEKQRPVDSQLPSFTSIVHTLSETQPHVTCPTGSDKYSSLLHKRSEPMISAALSIAPAVPMFGQAQSHAAYNVSGEKHHVLSQSGQESGIPVSSSSVSSVHPFCQAQASALFSVSDGKSSSQLKQESVLSFTPVHSYSLTQPHIIHPGGHKSSLSLQHKCDSAVSATSSVMQFSHTQPQVSFSSSNDSCNYQVQYKHKSTNLAASSLTPVHTFSQTQSPQSNVTYSGSGKSSLSLQQKHESAVSAAAFVPQAGSVSGVQTSVISTTNSLRFSEQQFSASTFTPVSQTTSEIRTQASVIPNLNCVSASNSWLPTSGVDRSWFPSSKPLNPVSAVHRKAGGISETISSTANLSLQANEFPSDIFASLQVPSSGQHPESISPTAAFLLAFPLVSSSKVSDMIDPQDVDCDSLHGTSSLLQIGNIEHYSTPKKDMLVTSSTMQQTNVQPPMHKSQLSGKGRNCGSAAETGDKTLNDRDFFLSSQLSFVSDHKQNMGSKIGSNMKSSEISTSTSSNMAEECVEHSIANRSVGTQFKLTDMCMTKSMAVNAVSKQYVPTTYNVSYSSTDVSVANTVSLAINSSANTLATNGRSELKTTVPVNAHGLFSSAGLTYETPVSSFSSHAFHSQDKSKKINDVQLPVISKGQNLSVPVEMPEQKWSHRKSDNSEKQNSTGAITCRKSNNFPNKDRISQLHSLNRSVSNTDIVDLDLYKAGLASHNPGPPKFETSQTCSTTVSGTGTNQCTSSLPSNLPCSYNFSHEGKQRITSSQVVCAPTFSGSHPTTIVSTCSTIPSCTSFSILPWTTSVTSVGHCSVSSTAPSVAAGMSHQCPATQYVPPRGTASAANCANSHYRADASYSLPSSKHVVVTSNKQEMAGGGVKNLDGIPSKFGGPCGNKFVKVSSNGQHMMEDGMKLFSSDSVAAVMSNETADSFKFAQPSDQHQMYHQNMHRPPVNWMTTPAVSANQSKHTFGSYFPVPSSMEIPSSSELDTQQLRNSTYRTVTNLDSAAYTPSTSSCYSKTSQHSLYQVKTSSEKQQNTSATTSYENDTQNNSSRLALQNNNSGHISQIQQNEFYTAPWTQIKPPFPPDAVSSDVNNLFIPSTLPTLVGDLALGTGCIMNTLEENNANKSFGNPEYNSSGNHAKEQKLDMNGRQIKNRQAVKDSGRKSKQNMDCTHDFGSVSHAVASSAGSTFLSVSQLVDPMKSAVDSSGCHGSLHGYSMSNSSQPVTNSKPLHQQNAGSSGKRESLTQGKDDAKKVERPHNVATNNPAYHTEGMPQPVLPTEQAKREDSKTNEASARNTLEYQSATADTYNWLPGDSVSRKQTRAGGSNYKTQLSTYSAESLIGINQNTSVNGSTAHNISHKVISLPPPVVSDRFDNQNSYGNSYAQRKIPYGDGALLPSGYNIRPLDLPMSQDFTSQPSSVANHQGHQTYNGNAPQYSTVGGLGPSGHRRESSSICSAPYFTSTVQGTNANSMAQGYIPDLGMSDCGSRTQDGKKSNSFPTFSFSKESCPPKNEKQNFMYSQLATSSSSSMTQHAGHIRSKTETSTGAANDELSGGKAASNHNINNNNNNRQGGSGGATLTSQNVAGGSNCLLGKQRGRKRPPDAATSVSSIGNLMDLGYLTMPPGIGSPMLGDDSMYFSHTANFHGGPPTLYPGGPSGMQGSYYAPPRAPFPPCNTAAPRTLQQATASPNATNPSGTTLANFNLSTIFPEIMDKQASTVSAAEFPAKPADGGVQHAQGPLMGAACATSAPSYPHAPAGNLGSFPHANPGGTRTQWL